MPNISRTHAVPYLPDEMEDIQPPPTRHLPTSQPTNKERKKSKGSALKPAVEEPYSPVGYRSEKGYKQQKQTAHLERHSEPDSESGAELNHKFDENDRTRLSEEVDASQSDRSAEDSEVELVEHSRRPVAQPRPRVEEHIDVMQEGQANLQEQVDELSNKVEYYKGLSESRLVDIVRWVDGYAPRPPWAPPVASGSGIKSVKTENIKVEGDELQLSAPKRSRKKKEADAVIKSSDEVDLASDLSTHIRNRFFEWTGSTDTTSLNEPRFNGDDTPKFWVKDNRGVDRLHPHWGPNLGVNMSGPGAWVGGFIQSCMDPKKMPPGMAERFGSFATDDYLKALYAGVFASMSSNWKKKSNGELEMKSEMKKITNRRNARNKKKLDTRQANRAGTILAGPEWDPSFQLRCVSPEYSDAENKSAAHVIEEQEWLDPIVRQAHQALDRKALIGNGVVALPPPRRAVMVTGPIPLTKKHKSIPRWMVSDSYASKYPQFLAAVGQAVDLTQTNRPSVAELTKMFPVTPRNHIPARPKTVGDEALLSLSAAEVSGAGYQGVQQDTPGSAAFEPQPTPSEPLTPRGPSLSVCASNVPLAFPSVRNEPTTNSTSPALHENLQPGHLPDSSAPIASVPPILPTPMNPPHLASQSPNLPLDPSQHEGSYIQGPQATRLAQPAPSNYSHQIPHNHLTPQDMTPVFILHDGQYYQVMQPHDQLSGNTGPIGAPLFASHHGPMHSGHIIGPQAHVGYPPMELPGPSPIPFDTFYQGLPDAPSFNAGRTQGEHSKLLNEVFEDKDKDVYKPPPVYSIDGVRMNTPPILDPNIRLESTAQMESVESNIGIGPTTTIPKKRGRPPKTEEQKHAEEAKRQKQADAAVKRKETRSRKKVGGLTQ
ncbi:AT hook motif protein, partial [Rhizoctonia solani AG-3 Rhs1AP]